MHNSKTAFIMVVQKRFPLPAQPEESAQLSPGPMPRRESIFFWATPMQVAFENLCPSCADFRRDSPQRGVDVTDKSAMENWIAEADAISPLDLVIANAGISHGNLVDEETPEQIRAVFAVNLDGMLNTVLPALPRMRSRKRGQIALMSSGRYQGLSSCALILRNQSRDSSFRSRITSASQKGRRFCIGDDTGICKNANDGRQCLRYAGSH